MPAGWRKWGLAVGLLAMLTVGVAWASWQGPRLWRSYLLDRAADALAADNLGEAAKLLRQVTRDQPGQWRGHLLYAQTMRRLGRTYDAEMALERAVEAGMPEIEGRKEYALLEARQDFAGVANLLQDLAQQRPDDAEIQQALAEGAAHDRRWVLAERAYSRMLAAQPDRLDLLFERGYVRWRERLFGKAAEDLGEVVRRSPRPLFSTRLLLARCLLSDAQVAEAEAEFRACHQLHPEHSDPLVGLAVCATEHGHSDRSQALLREALARDPASVWALNELGNLLLFRQDYRAAVGAFQQLLRANPKNTEGHRKPAQALRGMGDRAAAEAEERRYQELKQAEEHPAPAAGGETAGRRTG
jgi:cytochrome c-type biogenesis protein CcmH/NrfG